MMSRNFYTINGLLPGLAILLLVACKPQSDPTPGPDPDPDPAEAAYIYPFGTEAGNVVAEITLQTDGSVDLDAVTTEIPALKYNKSWMLMLTQDDCKQTAYCCTWAAINGKPLSDQHYYDAAHLRAGDLPPDAYTLDKTLGSTDGAGNEVRFSFATTLAPEKDWMSAKTTVNKGYTGNYYRFFMKRGLIWDNVIEMCNYGVGIAFHDVEAGDVGDASAIAEHYGKAQDIILEKLSGRGCKFLAEPNGNKTYVAAAQSYAPIQTITAQNTGAGFTVERIYPFKVTTDLYRKLALRTFYEYPEYIKPVIAAELSLPPAERKAILLGTHATTPAWTQFLLWLNDTYGKDGDNSLWMPSQEEYYEYNYYRTHGSVQKTVSGNTLKITVTMPSGQYFYYPSVTVNLKGALRKANVASVSSNDAVTGLSYGDYEGGVMVNVDCRRALAAHAAKFVERYEKDKSEPNRRDALYFVGMLKESPAKEALLRRVK